MALSIKITVHNENGIVSKDFDEIVEAVGFLEHLNEDTLVEETYISGIDTFFMNSGVKRKTVSITTTKEDAYEISKRIEVLLSQGYVQTYVGRTGITFSLPN